MSSSVAPLAGAWIERLFPVLHAHGVKSRPSRARGLKGLAARRGRAPTSSRPSRARGLKVRLRTLVVCIMKSRPSRARGLKVPERVDLFAAGDVAPLAGAWIESAVTGLTTSNGTSRPSRARGLKGRPCTRHTSSKRSRPSRARGLKARQGENLGRRNASRPSRARGLKGRYACAVLMAYGRAPRGRVD